MRSVTIWRTLFARHFGVSVLRNALGGSSGLSVDWKEEFRQYLADEAARNRRQSRGSIPLPRGSFPLPIFPLLPGRNPRRPLFPFPYFIPPPAAPRRPYPTPFSPVPRPDWLPSPFPDGVGPDSSNNGPDWFFTPPFM
mmetsp:Transcript_15747/g.25186  ORF Transcript_15747/g.25186 Transcript_15747/m.25186 type:complete len:138 (+) Transcript_15747:245-658(+)